MATFKKLWPNLWTIQVIHKTSFNDTHDFNVHPILALCFDSILPQFFMSSNFLHVQFKSFIWQNSRIGEIICRRFTSYALQHSRSSDLNSHAYNSNHLWGNILFSCFCITKSLHQLHECLWLPMVLLVSCLHPREWHLLCWRENYPGSSAVRLVMHPHDVRLSR